MYLAVAHVPCVLTNTSWRPAWLSLAGIQDQVLLARKRHLRAGMQERRRRLS